MKTGKYIVTYTFEGRGKEQEFFSAETALMFITGLKAMGGQLARVYELREQEISEAILKEPYIDYRDLLQQAYVKQLGYEPTPENITENGLSGDISLLGREGDKVIILSKTEVGKYVNVVDSKTLKLEAIEID